MKKTLMEYKYLAYISLHLAIWHFSFLYIGNNVFEILCISLLVKIFF